MSHTIQKTCNILYNIYMYIWRLPVCSGITVYWVSSHGGLFYSAHFWEGLWTACFQFRLVSELSRRCAKSERPVPGCPKTRHFFFTDFGLEKIRPGSHGLSVRDSRLKPFLLKSSISFTTELIFRFWRQSVLQPESSSRFRMSSLLY